VGAGDFEGILGFVQGVRITGPHLLVMLTSPNAAKMVAEAITAAEWPEVAGVLSGDDTLFIATATEEGQAALLGRFKQYLKRGSLGEIQD
jgi:arginine repressor